MKKIASIRGTLVPSSDRIVTSMATSGSVAGFDLCVFGVRRPLFFGVRFLSLSIRFVKCIALLCLAAVHYHCCIVLRWSVRAQCIYVNYSRWTFFNKNFFYHKQFVIIMPAHVSQCISVRNVPFRNTARVELQWGNMFNFNALCYLLC